MKNFNKAIVISSLLIVYLLILTLLGESFLQYLIIGIGSLALLYLNKKYGNWSNLNKYPKINLLLIIFYLGLIFSSIFTQSIPFTLSKLNFYSLTLGLFVSTLIFAKKINTTWLFIIITTLTWNIVAISTFFKFFPNFGQLLPGINIIYESFGHNHIASLLLLVIPISWWLPLNLDKKIKEIIPIEFFNFLPVFFSLSLLFSFGRLGVLLGFIQVIIVRLYFKKQKISIPKNVLLVQRIIEILFISALIFKLALSLLNISCPDNSFKNKICKPVGTEPRPYYWLQAISAIKNSALTGTGPGTFTLSNQKFKQTPLLNTSFAHNQFLETYSETGIIVGSVFLLLMLSIIFKITNKKILTQSANKSWLPLIWLSILSSYINAFFDFDWSFTIIFSITLVFAAVLLRKNIDEQQKIIKLKLAKITQILVTLFLTFSVALMVVYSIVELKIYQKNLIGSFNFFPYFHWHKELYKRNLPTEYYPKLLSIYKNETEFYQFLIEKETDETKLATLKESLFDLDKWEKFANNNLGYYLKTNNLEQAKKEIEEIEDLRLVAQKMDLKWVIKSNNIVNLASNYLKTADLLMFTDPRYAAKLYQKAQEIDPWAWAHHDSILLSSPATKHTNEKLAFMRSFPNQNNKFWGNKLSDYSEYYLSLALAEKNENELKNDLEKIVTTADWLSWEAWVNLSHYYKDRIIATKDSTELEKISDDWFEVWNLLKKYKPGLAYQEENDLTKALVEIGNQLVDQSIEKTIEKYQQAEQIRPEVFDQEEMWFEKPNITTTINQSKITVLLEGFTKFKINNFSEKRRNKYWQIWENNFKYYLENKDFKQAQKIVSLVQPIEDWGYETRLKLVSYMQAKANSYVFEQKNYEAISFTELMAMIAPDNYWAITQNAFLYLYIGEKDQAKREFTKCLKDYKNTEHSDCKFYLENIDTDKIDQKKYLDVSEKILSY